MSAPICVVDYQPRPVDVYREGQWFLWDAVVRFADGTEKTGTIQGDGHDNWAYETFEADE